jgi:hypothetical protein
MNDLVAKRELAFEAKDILESKAFEKVQADMRDSLVNELLTVRDRERRDDIVAELRVLGFVLGRLKTQINEYNAAVRAQGRSAA